MVLSQSGRFKYKLKLDESLMFADRTVNVLCSLPDVSVSEG